MNEVAVEQVWSGARHSNSLVAFLRHYGPIPASDNMYDELIQAELAKYKIDPPVTIPPARLTDLSDNFDNPDPDTVVLTGTAGDGKTFHCRQIWERYDGDPAHWQQGNKFAKLTLPRSGKQLIIVKDLSELSSPDKAWLFPRLSAAVVGQKTDEVFLVAANDGQLIASWREWAEARDADHLKTFTTMEDMLVEDRTHDPLLRLRLYNLSHFESAEHFAKLLDQVVEHPQWTQCSGCELLESNGTSRCPIRLNRNLLRGEMSTFRQRLKDLLRLARANRLHVPIRDLLLLTANIILGDQQQGQILLSCRTARNRAEKGSYQLTNPFANAFGENLSAKDRQKYQVFPVLESFGIGHETDNAVDNLLIYGPTNDPQRHTELVGTDPYYGASVFDTLRRNYIEGERNDLNEFLVALTQQRRRLFFSLPDADPLDPWILTVYRLAGRLLDFVRRVHRGDDVSGTVRRLARGLNRTFCGMMIDESTQLHLATSGGDGRGRIASFREQVLLTIPHKRDIYLTFRLAEDRVSPLMIVKDPTRSEENGNVDSMNLPLTHFEYLMQVAEGSLPASFSRHCYEDFLDFKLRLLARLRDLVGSPSDLRDINLEAVTVDARGRAQIDAIRVQIDE